MKTPDHPTRTLAIRLSSNGFKREYNGGGCWVWIKPVGSWVISVCNGCADEPQESEDRIHINAHKSDDCEVFIPGCFVVPDEMVSAIDAMTILIPTLSNNQKLP